MKRRHNSYTSFSIFDWEIFGPLLLVVAIVLGGGGWALANNAHKEVKTCTVTEKDRTKNEDGSSDMRIYTEECGTLSVGDSLLNGVFNSADVFGSIQEGQTYTFKTVGFRVPVISAFPTIIEVQ